MTSVQRSGFISSKTVRYILIIAILAIAFSVSFMIRSQGAQVGFELAEFDPFFNYRATNFILENGIPAYFEWWDDKSWFLNIEPKITWFDVGSYLQQHVHLHQPMYLLIFHVTHQKMYLITKKSIGEEMFPKPHKLHFILQLQYFTRFLVRGLPCIILQYYFL